MTSLRLALKQSLEETTGGFSPPSEGNQPNTPSGNPNTAAPLSPGAAGGVHPVPAGGAAVALGPHLPSDAALSGLGSPTWKKRGPGRPRKNPANGDEPAKKRGRPRKNSQTEDGHDGNSSSEHDYSGSEQEEGEVEDVKQGEDDEHNDLKMKKAMVAAAAGSVSTNEQPEHTAHAVAKSASSTTDHDAPREESAQREQKPSVKEHGAATASASGGREKEPSDGKPGGARAKTVPGPDQHILQWSRGLPIKQARHSAKQGLRVKVRFSTRVKRDGKLVRKKKWYGGVVSQVSKAGSKIRIKYDDGTSEVSKFPDKDVVVDETMNGQHSCSADFFTPPDIMSEDEEGEVKEAGEVEPELNQKPKAEPPTDVLPQPQEEKQPPIPQPAEQQSAPTEPEKDIQKTDAVALAENQDKAETAPIHTTVAADVAPLPENESVELLQPTSEQDAAESSLAAEEEIPKPKRKRGRPPKVRPQPQDDTNDVEQSQPTPATTPMEIEEATPFQQEDPAPAASLSPTPTVPAADFLVDTPVPNDTATPGSSKQPESMNIDKEVQPEKIQLSPEEEEKRAPKLLSIRIPNVKPNEPAKDPAQLRQPENAEAEDKPKEDHSPKRIHISMPKPPVEKESIMPIEPQESTRDDSGRVSPPPPSDTEKPVESEIAPPTSPSRSKKAKRKRGDLSPRPRSRSPKPDESGDKLSVAETAVPEIVAAVEGASPADAEQDVSKPHTPRPKHHKNDARSGRKLDEQPIDPKVDPTQEQVSKKKKKRDRRREHDGEGSEKEEGAPGQQAPWVQCDKCGKWRIIPKDVVGSLPDRWFCADNVWDPKRASCDAAQQKDRQLVRERKRRKRQRLLEKEQEGRGPPDANDGNSEGSHDKDTVVAPRVLEEPGDSNKRPRRASPTEDPQQHSDSSINNEKQKAAKKVAVKKTRSNHAAAEPPAENQEEPPEVKPKRGRPRRNAGKETNPAPNNNEQTPEEAAENLEWVQCEKCEKWRKLPPQISADELPDVWYCSMNTWNPGSASCSAPEDKAEAGLTDIFSNGADKLSYRNLIFGNGRKFNRPISERTRAAESIFAAVSDDTDAPPAVSYANSSAFICRSKLNQMDDSEAFSVLNLMSRSHLWEELRQNQNGKGLCAFDNLMPDVKESMKDLILNSLGSRTLSGDEVANDIQHRNWQNVPLGWAAAKPYCTVNTLVMTMCDLVKEGVLECIKDFANGSSGPFVLCYRRNQSYSKAAVRIANDGTDDVDASGRCTKFSKPWKAHGVE